jgi:hypothetical protein
MANKLKKYLVAFIFMRFRPKVMQTDVKADFIKKPQTLDSQVFGIFDGWKMGFEPTTFRTTI